MSDSHMEKMPNKLPEAQAKESQKIIDSGSQQKSGDIKSGGNIGQQQSAGGDTGKKIIEKSGDVNQQGQREVLHGSQ